MNKKLIEDFYKHFKMGIEIELEAEGFENVPLVKLQLKSDGSLRATKGNTSLGEIIPTKPWKKASDEEEFFTEMKTFVKEFESSKKEKMFAYKNDSCSTHVHFSFKDYGDEFLYIFDTLEFEKHFFMSYMKEFKSEKFLKRVNARWCRAPFLYSAKPDDVTSIDSHNVKKDLDNMNALHYEIEPQRSDGRYRWLNTLSIQEKKGMEIRVFPHMQTYEGIQYLLEFIKTVLMEYYLKTSTQQKLKLLEYYITEIESAGIDRKKLNQMKQIVYDALNLERKDKMSRTGEARIMLAKWVKSQPALLNQTNEVL